jgi:hypothetical protein
MATRIFNDEIIIGESLGNPVDFFSFVLLHQARDYQEDILLEAGNLCCASSRGIGKTWSIRGNVLYVAYHNPDKEGLITAPNAAHLKPLFEKIIGDIYNSPMLRRYVKRVLRSPDYYIEFSNGFKLHGRIAGTSGGTNVLGLHVDFLWVDEGQLYTQQPTEQLQGCLNEGCVIRIFGVPNGVRDSYLYKCSIDPHFKQFVIPKFSDPTWNQTMSDRFERIFGGKHSQGWQNQILALWGSLSHLTFPERHWRSCMVEVENYDPVIIDAEEGFKLSTDNIRLPFIQPSVQVSISMDAGYDPDPSIIGIWTKLDGAIKLVHKIVLRKVSYTEQAIFLDQLARYYNAWFVAVDVGGPGRTVYLDLSSEKLFINKPYVPVSVNFGSRVVTAKDLEGREITEKVKFFSTLQMQTLFEVKKLLLSKNDLAIEQEVLASTQTKASDGTYIYNEIPDHNLAMIRAQVIAPWIINSDKIVVELGNSEPCIGLASF